jgi:two-component system cell cycle response regulator DivK
MTGEMVLVIEDNDKNRKLVCDLLQVTGFRVLEAATATEGLALAAEHVPDLVLMDVQLPDIDGETALGRLRSDPRLAAIPVVAFTAFAMTTDRARFLRAGFDGYIAKPISVREFPGQVRQFAALRTGREA